MPSYKNAKEAQKAMGASIDETKKAKKKKKLQEMSEEKRQRKLDRAERKKYGGAFTSKKKKKKRALAARAKQRAKENLETVASKKIDEAVGYTEAEKDLGGSMGYKAKTKLFKMVGHNVEIPQKGASMENKQKRKDLLKYNPVVDKSKGMGGAGMYKKDGMSMYKKDGMSMYKKDGGSMYKKDGGSMYGKKQGSSMNKYDKDMMHERELIYDAKKQIHKEDMAKKAHAHPIMKHMRKF